MMSTSPAERTPGQTPNGTLPPLIRRRKAADPLVRPKDRNKRRPQRQALNPPSSANGVNGIARPNGATIPNHSRTQVLAQHPPRQPNQASPETTHSGFTSPAVAEYVDYPLIMTKKSLMDGLRLHVARFSSKKDIDPRNENDFTRPVRLHRRDAKAPRPGMKEDVPAETVDTKNGVLDEQEKERQEMLRAQREAEREAEAAKEAPSTQTGFHKRGGFKKKTEQRFRGDETEQQRAESKLRYEEALPWHLEDFDNKQTWVGSYEAAMSESYAQFVHQDGVFKVTPVEKWYKFAPKANFKTLSIEEAEKLMSSKVSVPRWLRDQLAATAEKTDQEKNVPNKLYTGKINARDDSKIMNAGFKREADDNDELDFEEDRFADDEENPVFEGEAEEAKEAEARIKRDQLQANIFDLKDEKSYDKAETIEKKSKDAIKRHGKKVKKALMKREKNYVYDDDSDNPYSSESESSDSEAERLKEEQQKKEAEEKKAAANEKAKGVPSGASTKGNNTPNHRPSKHLDPSMRNSSSASLKRPGSPNLSEASGNESARKKHKVKHGAASNLGTGISTPTGPHSRSRSPAPPGSSAPEQTTNRPTPPPQQLQHKLSGVRLSMGPENHKRDRAAASGSDGEGAGSAGDMSDGTRKRIRLKLSGPGSKNGTPGGSRATSPDQGSSAAGGNRALSPDQSTFPTAAEIKAIIPDEGTTIGELIKKFKGRIDGDKRKQQFISLMSSIAQLDSKTRLLKRKD